MSTTAPHTVYVVEAHALGDGTAEAAAGSETVRFDAGWAQPASGLPGPAELLAAAFAACLLKNVERPGQLLHQNLRRYGTVYNTLAAVCDVHGEVVATAPERA